MKVLILAYDFPPYVSVGGIRPWNWYSYMSEFGVEPIVVTRQWKNHFGDYRDYILASESKEILIESTGQGKIIRAPYTPNLANRLMLRFGEKRFKLVRKVISGFLEIAQFYFPLGPRRELYKAAKLYLKDNQVDAIIATGDPFVLFHYAKKLSRRTGTPWVADYRDPWGVGLEVERKPFLKWLNTRIEKRTVRGASLILTVDELFKRKIQRIFKSNRIEVIANGYNPEVFRNIPSNNSSNNCLKLAHAGTLYSWQPLESFISGWADALEINPDLNIELDFIGVNDPDRIINLLESKYPHLSQFIKLTPRIPNAELATYLSQKHILLLFTCYEFTGTKIYDYLAMNRHILYCFTADHESENLKNSLYFRDSQEGVNLRPQEDIMRSTSGGALCIDRYDLCEKLLKYWDDLTDKGAIESFTQNADRFSRKLQTKQFSELLIDLK